MEYLCSLDMPILRRRQIYGLGRDAAYPGRENGDSLNWVDHGRLIQCRFGFLRKLHQLVGQVFRV